MTQPPDSFTDQRLKKLRQWRKPKSQDQPISWRERAEEVYREILYRFWREADPETVEQEHPGAWAQTAYPELFEYWKQCERKAFSQTSPQEDPDLEKLVVDTRRHWSGEPRKTVDLGPFIDWVRSQSDSKKACKLLTHNQWSSLFETLASELPCPDTDFVEALTEVEKHNQLILWSALLDNPALQEPAAQAAGEHVVEQIVQLAWRSSHKKTSGSDVLGYFYEQGFRLEREAVEKLLQAATEIDENTYMFDTEAQQASRPGNARADQALQEISAYLTQDDLLRVLQSYRENDWAARELLKREDPELKVLRHIALYCGSYEIRKELLDYEQLLEDEQARASLNESHGQDVQLALLRTAQGDELRQRFVKMLEEQPQTTLEYLKNNQLTCPEDLNPDMLMPALKGADRQTRREAILLASKIHPESEPSQTQTR